MDRKNQFIEIASGKFVNSNTITGIYENSNKLKKCYNITIKDDNAPYGIDTHTLCEQTDSEPYKRLQKFLKKL